MAVITAIPVANTLLAELKLRGVSATPMKLQRMLYLVSVGYARETGQLLFSEPFACWQYGPVCPSVQAKFGCFKAHPVTKYGKDACGNALFLDLASSGPALRHAVADVVAKCARADVRALSNVVRTDGSAWERAFRSGSETLSDRDLRNDPCWDAMLAIPA